MSSRYTKNKVNPTFTDNNKRLTYTRWVYWDLIPEQSIGRPEDFMVTTLNPPYLGALAHAKNENLLPVGYGAVIVRELFEFLQGQYLQDTSAWKAPPAIVNGSDIVQQEYMQKFGVDAQAAKLWFYDQWANGTGLHLGIPKIDYWKISQFGSKVNGRAMPSNISLATAERLFDPSIAYSFTYPSASFFNNTVAFWRNATWDLQARATLHSIFVLTDSQMDIVISWVTSELVREGIFMPYLRSHYNFQTNDEMICLAYGQRGFGVGESVASLYPHIYGNGPVEYGYWQKAHSWIEAMTLSMDQCKKMFFTPPALTQATALGKFLVDITAASASQNFEYVTKRWGITNSNEVIALNNYFAVSSSSIANTYSVPAIKYWKTHGSGLFASRTAYEWLWNYTDPFAIRMLPDAPPMSFRHNLSTAEFAMQHTRPWTVGTGVKDISELQNTYVWDGMAEAPFYGAPLPVEGATEDGQYPPFVKCQSDVSLKTWVDDYAKDIPLVCIDDKSKVLDVKTTTWTPDNSTWLVDPQVENFIAGFSNLSAKYNDSPVFLSNPHFFGVPEYYHTRVSGDGGNPIRERDQTIVYIEPYTGKVAKFRKGLQANLYIAANTSWFSSSEYANMYTDVMFPVMVGYVNTEINSHLSSLVTGTIYVALKLFVILFWIFVALSVVFLFGILIAAIVYHRRVKAKSKEGYNLIQ